MMKNSMRNYLDEIIIDNGNGAYPIAEGIKALSDVPTGTLLHSILDNSDIFPGSIRDYWLYIPAQYRPNTPAALLVLQDGGLFLGKYKGAPENGLNMMTVLDNLIHQQLIPVTIGVFINPGQYPDIPMPTYIPDQPRQVEYDSQNDIYARFLLSELLPVIEERYKLSPLPSQRVIGGYSSGGMCAWNVAWHRPDSFGKVLSFCGSFTDVRGGHNVPSMIRKTSSKPIRVFLQSGLSDQDSEFGHWGLANHTMAAALAFKDYDYRFVYGDGGHDLNHAAAILPEALQWLME